ncbi:hypothetical protein EXS73_02045 [Candidatus Pacearchaeota archaeon]|nr:hypothetical protein [Candidatus Pacearchaeota archaeon]
MNTKWIRTPDMTIQYSEREERVEIGTYHLSKSDARRLLTERGGTIKDIISEEVYLFSNKDLTVTLGDGLRLPYEQLRRCLDE